MLTASLPQDAIIDATCSSSKISLFSVIGKNFVRLNDYSGHRAHGNTAAHRLVAKVAIRLLLTDLTPFHEDRLSLLNFAVGAKRFFESRNFSRLSSMMPSHASREHNVRIDRRRLDRLHDHGVRCYFIREPRGARVLGINYADDYGASISQGGIEEGVDPIVDQAQQQINTRIDPVIRRPCTGDAASQSLEMAYKEFGVTVARMHKHGMQVVEISARSRQHSFPFRHNAPTRLPE